MTDDVQEARGRLEEALAARRAKLDRLRARGVEPFALGYEPDRSLADVRAAQRHKTKEA